MQSKLEDVLKNKERELKLFQRFLDLKSFCEEQFFGLVDLPLKQHVESLKELIEKIIPDPKDRTEEMFSGEIFTLLGTIYLHDIGLVKDYHWDSNKEIISALDGNDKQMFLNYGIGEKLNIPGMAIEIINYLTFSNVLRKIPIEWTITEDSRKAIIRNTKVISHVFNFSHLLIDIFYSDLRYPRIRRYHDKKFVLDPREAAVDIDSREGIIHIKYNAKFPYELHVLKDVKNYVDNMFSIFKNNVNGKHGFQYKDIIWDITSDFTYEKDVFEVPKFSPYNEYQGPPFERWEKASLVLDKLFDHGYAIVAGEAATGKTTVLRSFVMPQILSISSNVYYCEMWENPVGEIKDVICSRLMKDSSPELDVISLCKKLLDNGPCFFIIDNCERYIYVNAQEREKFERFISFCIEHNNIYLIISGEKETFFEWYEPFSNMHLSALCEIKPLESSKAADKLDAFREDKIIKDMNERYKPIEFELLLANISVEKVIEDVLKGVKEERDFRKIVACITDRNAKHLKRYTAEDIFLETHIPHKKIIGYLNLLKEKDIVRESESSEQVYYYLSSRYLKEPLYTVLKLEQFEEVKKIRNILQNSIANDLFLDAQALQMLESWKDDIVFSKEEMGLILSSLINQSETYINFLEKAKKDGRGIDIQPILKLLYIEDAEKREEAIKLLIEIQDKDMVNPLLSHLKKENVLEIKDLLIKGISLTGKKKTILAIMNALKEINDRQLRLRAIDFFYSLLDVNLKDILADIREKEEDPAILMKIDSILSEIRETV
jgi:hypothetical protein